jgi:hypothetical protein
VSSKRKPSTSGEKTRAWARKHRELIARENAITPPAPDKQREPAAWREWAQKSVQRGMSPELRKHLDDLKKLPSVKYRKERDHEVGSWISALLICQEQGAPYDLSTCKLGANPANPNAQPSKMLRYLLATLANVGHPNVDPCRLFDAIRHWRKQRKTVSTI